ncbi:hypothetical protein TNCV_1989231 [Trichonephila clavipes]|nr:hypothetical protein TNCV_1989231 [Trichonephila clavipes]
MVGRNFLVRKALGEETIHSQANCFQWDNSTGIERFISWQVASLANWSAVSLGRFPLWLRTAFRWDSSSKLEIDESNIVLDQDCMADNISAPNQEFQYSFALPSPSVVSHCHPTAERQIREAHATFSKSICLITVDLYPVMYRCLARSPVISSFAYSR